MSDDKKQPGQLSDNQKIKTIDRDKLLERVPASKVNPLGLGRPPLTSSAPPRDVLEAAKAYTDEREQLIHERIGAVVDDLAAAERAIRKLEALAARVEELEEQIGAAKHDAAIARAHTEVLSENLGDRVRYLEESHKGVAVPLFNVQREQGLHLEALDSHSDRIAKLEERVARLATGGDVYTMRLALQECHDRLCKIENRGLASQAGQCPHGWGDGCIDCDDANENDGPIGEPAQSPFWEAAKKASQEVADMEEWQKKGCAIQPAQPIAGAADTGAHGGIGGGSPAPQRVPQTEAPIAIEVGQVWRFDDGSGDIRVARCDRVHTEEGQSYFPETLREHATLVEPAPVYPEECLSCGRTMCGGSCSRCGWKTDNTYVEPAPKTHPVWDLPAATAPETPAAERPTAPGGWCPQCGPVTRVDEDGCCLSCGCDAHGEGADLALGMLGSWTANVPEPPPVDALERGVDVFDRYGGRQYGGRPITPEESRAVADWLRSVAAAMGK